MSDWQEANAEAKAAKARANAFRPWFKKKRYWLLGLIIISVVVSALSGGDSSTGSSSKSSDNSMNNAGTNVDINAASPQETSAPKETAGQKNARAKAKTYLDIMAFSRSGLIKQLNFEGFSDSDATYAVGAITVDWNQQAALKAKTYLDIMAFSRSGLITQLLFDGFTKSQAEYGVSKTGL